MGVNISEVEVYGVKTPSKLTKMYLGCHRDKVEPERDLPKFIDWGAGYHDKCLRAVAERGFAYAGLEHGRDCWAGH